jgi:hypothetical protein
VQTFEGCLASSGGIISRPQGACEEEGYHGFAHISLMFPTLFLILSLKFDKCVVFLQIP